MRESFRAQKAWREVIGAARPPGRVDHAARRRPLLSTAASEAGEDTVELQVQKLTLLRCRASRSGRAGQALRRGRRRCGRSSAAARPWRSLASAAADASFEDLEVRQAEQHCRADAVAAAQRQGRRHAAAVDGGPRRRALRRVRPRGRSRPTRSSARRPRASCAQKEFEIVAKRHLRDLRQDAHIEYR